MNRLIEKIRSYLKDMNLDELKYKYQDQSTNDDFIEYEPLPESMIDDSNEDLENTFCVSSMNWFSKYNHIKNRSCLLFLAAFFLCYYHQPCFEVVVRIV